MMDVRQVSGLWSTFEGLNFNSNGGEESQYSSIQEFRPGWKLHLGFSSLCLVVFMVGMDMMSLGTSLPAISVALGTSTTQAIWAIVSLYLTSTIFSLLFVQFSSIFGRTPMMLIALLFFATGGITTSFASNPTMLIAGRSVQGIGSGAIVVLTEVIITGIVPLRKRGVWFGFVNSFWCAGMVAGPIVGGVLVENGLWRWIFRLGVPACALTGALVPWCFKFQIKRKAGSIPEALLKFDWFGLLLFIVSITAFSTAVTMGGITSSWNSWIMITLISAGSVSGLAFIILEAFYHKSPLLRLYLCNRATTSIVFLNNFLFGYILFSLLFYLPIYYQAVKSFSPTRSGIAILPETLTIGFVSLLVGVLVNQTGRYKWSTFTGWAVITIGISLFMLLDEETSPGIWISLNIGVGIGLGILFSGITISIQATSVSLGQSSVFSISMLHFFRFYGGTTGLSISFAILQTQSLAALSKLPRLTPDSASLIRNLINIQTVAADLDSDETVDFKIAYAEGLNKVWLGICIAAVIGTLSCVFMNEYPLPARLDEERRRSSAVALIRGSVSESSSEMTEARRQSNGNSLLRHETRPGLGVESILESEVGSSRHTSNVVSPLSSRVVSSETLRDTVVSRESLGEYVNVPGYQREDI